ncbi:MAG: hypothetical protein FJW30_07300 [Acidobacteria bacterium]|nr:hypothetical protein [Acidobacteriota bacterium]
MPFALHAGIAAGQSRLLRPNRPRRLSLDLQFAQQVQAVRWRRFFESKRIADFMATAVSRMAKSPVPPLQLTRLAAAGMQNPFAALPARARDFESACSSGKPYPAMAIAKVERTVLLKVGLPGPCGTKASTLRPASAPAAAQRVGPASA